MKNLLIGLYESQTFILSEKDCDYVGTCIMRNMPNVQFAAFKISESSFRIKVFKNSTIIAYIKIKFNTSYVYIN